MTMQVNPVEWFEIPVLDMGRAKQFYRQVFGIELQEHRIGPLSMAWLPRHEEAIGATGSLVQGEGYKPSFDGVLVYFTAPDIEALLAGTKSNGGQVIAEKRDIGEYGCVALIRDSGGNRIGLHARE